MWDVQVGCRGKVRVGCSGGCRGKVRVGCSGGCRGKVCVWDVQVGAGPPTENKYYHFQDILKVIFKCVCVCVCVYVCVCMCVLCCIVLSCACICVLGHPDMTFTVDWALSNNYLSTCAVRACEDMTSQSTILFTFIQSHKFQYVIKLG